MSACCGFMRRNAAIVVLSVLLVVAVVWWWREARMVPPSTPPVEMVEVLVAAKDLATGTPFNKENVAQLTEFRLIAKVELPGDTKIIHHRGELIGLPLYRPIRQGEILGVADAGNKSPPWFADEDEIISIPMPSKTLTGLIALELSDTNVTDAGLGELAALNNFRNLDVGRTQVTDAGLKKLASMKNLTGLTLSDLPVTDVGLMELASLPNLSVLGLYQTNVTDAGVERLQKALPYYKIYR